MPTLKKSASKKAKKSRMAGEMRKFSSGDLKSSSGQKVTNPAQAKAIAMSESGQSNPRAKTKPPTDDQRGAVMKANTAAKKRRKRNIGRS